MADLRKNVAAVEPLPPVLLFFQGSPADGQAFFHRLWPEARAVSDLQRQFYTAFDIERGGIAEMFGPEVWACGMRASAKGHSIGRPVGDPWLMPGMFIIQEQAVIWQHTFRHAGDHPDLHHVLSRMTNPSSSEAG